MMKPLDLKTARQVAKARCAHYGVSLVTPESDPVEVDAIRLAITAVTPLTAKEVRARISFYAPELAEDVLTFLPAPIRKMLGPAFPLILLGDNAWNDAIDLPGTISHELGHHLREKAARERAGVIGSVLLEGGYLLHPMVRISDESTCYTCNIAAAVILRAEDPKVAADRVLDSLRTIYRTDDTSMKLARGILASCAASLARFQLPGIRTPLQGTLQALRAKGVDFGPWNAAIGLEGVS